MKYTLSIMQYHDKTMRDILDNLEVWDWEKKITHKNCIKYKEEKCSSLTGSCSIFTITAVKEPFLVFYTIGEQVEKRINKPVNDLAPKFVS